MLTHTLNTKLPLKRVNIHATQVITSLLSFIGPAPTENTMMIRLAAFCLFAFALTEAVNVDEVVPEADKRIDIDRECM